MVNNETLLVLSAVLVLVALLLRKLELSPSFRGLAWNSAGCIWLWLGYCALIMKL